MNLTVNGGAYDVAAPDNETLVVTLRERLELTGTKLVCGRGECGACTVLVSESAEPRHAVYACLTLTAACEGHAITTIEGLADGDELHAVQRAFIEHDALQCGFCTPGQILAAVALIADSEHLTEDEVTRGMSGNLCRCGTYPKIVRAILAAAADGA
jgi:xanthine dehydrogenase YagT iron-sulfur-binding subunit